MRKFEAIYRHGTMFAPKQSSHQKEAMGKERLKNVNHELVQATYRPIWTIRLPGWMQRRIGPTIEIYLNLELPIAMVPCLHQSNIHIKRKIWGG